MMFARRFLGAVALVALAAGCGEEAPPEVMLPPVTLAEVEARNLSDHIEASGELLARDEAEVAAEVAGRVTAIRHDEGSSVDAGTVVVAIDPERRKLELANTRAHLAEAQANLEDAEREVTRIQRLFDEGVASQARLDTVQTELRLARSRHDAARAQVGVADRALRDANVRAPFAGVVSRRHVSAGEYVQAGDHLFDLVALDPIEVEFHLAEVDSGSVTVGDRVGVRVAPYPDEVFPAEVTFVSPTIDPHTRTLRVRGLLPNGDGRLRPGLFARADLGVSERTGVAMVPEEAVLQRAEGEVVFRLVEGNRVQRLRVETGVHDAGSVEVVSGLSIGDQVVSRGHQTLADGAVVAPRSRTGDETPALAGGLDAPRPTP